MKLFILCILAYHPMGILASMVTALCNPLVIHTMKMVDWLEFAGDSVEEWVGTLVIYGLVLLGHSFCHFLSRRIHLFRVHSTTIGVR